MPRAGWCCEASKGRRAEARDEETELNRMRPGLTLLLLAVGGVCALVGQPAKRESAARKEAASGTPAVTAVRFWSLGATTRIAIEVSGEVKARAERLHGPERIAIDITEARMKLGDKGVHVVAVGDKLLKQIRVAQKEPLMTRVVLDLEGAADYELSQVTGPARVMVELKAQGAQASETLVSKSRTGAEKMSEKNLQPGAVLPEASKQEPPKLVELSKAETPKKDAPKADAPKAEATTKDAPKTEVAKAVEPPKTVARKPEERIEAPAEKLPDSSFERKTAGRTAKGKKAEAAKPVKTPPVEMARAAEPVAVERVPDKAPEVVIPPSSNEPDDSPKAARPTSTGSRTLSRALGLKVNRVVLDAGHGGHDHGTTGPTGLAEKELVLDVVLRLGALLEQGGVDVVYTRKTDVFIPLDERPVIANQHKADLFLSIHANASAQYKNVSGAEVYYLNMATSREAMDVAARENAGYTKSISDLRDLMQKIMLRDKVEESKEFAARVQAPLSSTWMKMTPVARNRGVKKALFVVLIGASMPSILAEIGFLSNPKDEAMLKKPESRQRLAEALFRGIQSYSGGLAQAPVGNLAASAATGQGAGSR